MTTFDEREKAFENKFKHDEELQFKVEVRRNKLLGLWIGELMGLNEAESQAYAKEVIEADFEEVGIEDVVRKVLADCEAKNVDLSEHRLRKHIDELSVEAKKQIMSE
jgi:hypothetical protein